MRDEKVQKKKDERMWNGVHSSLILYPSSLLFHPWFSAASIALNIALALFTVS
jgi:hypothetical protein